jgi:hypothetical protein
MEPLIVHDVRDVIQLPSSEQSIGVDKTNDDRQSEDRKKSSLARVQAGFNVGGLSHLSLSLGRSHSDIFRIKKHPILFSSHFTKVRDELPAPSFPLMVERRAGCLTCHKKSELV